MADLAGWIAPAAMAVALSLDLALGEPPARVHPVVAMGHYLAAAGRRIPRSRPSIAFAVGALAWLVGACAVGLAAWHVQAWVVDAMQPWAAALLLGLALKPLLAWRMLRSEVQGVEAALAGSLAAGRARLARLVSRDVQLLDATAVRESAIESLAENLNDSVVAPLFWFAVAGLPGAAVYRFANTADAMWGYRGLREGRDWTWAGKWAARADDVLSWLPARITAVALGAGRAFRDVAREAARTPSPNSGWPMAAMAVSLGVVLRKPGVYVLNAAGRPATAQDTARALRRAARALGWSAAALAALAAARGMA